MPTELFANNPSTTLASSALAGDATISVTSSTSFPAAVTGTSQFRILVESEIMIVTNVSGTTWTVTRGAESTTAAGHAAGVAVTHIVTAAALTNLDASSLAVGTVADARLPTTMAGKTFSSATTVQGNVTINPAGTAGIEHGRTDGVASTPYIDFHSGATAVDYDARIQASGGTGVAGQGALAYSASGGHTFTGTISGNGSGLTSLNADSLASGTVAAARIRPTSLWNASVSTPAAGFASDTYLVGSSISVPASSLQATTQYRLKFSVTKTAAGLAAPVVTVRFGTAGTTADTAICALTFAAQTAAIDEGFVEAFVTFRTVGSGTSAVAQGVGTLTHRLAATGLSTSGTSVAVTTGAGFNSTISNAIIGASVNGGASAAWTIALVQAELFNLV